MHMQAKACLAPTGVQIKTYTTRTILNSNTIHQKFTLTHLLPLPKKCPKTSYRKKHFAIKCKNMSCRDALPPKNTSLETNENNDYAHLNTCTHHCAMHYCRVWCGSSPGQSQLLYGGDDSETRAASRPILLLGRRLGS